MEPLSAGDLVRVAAGGPELDGIVHDTPSRTKVVVAVVDPAKGPVLRTVHPRTLSERTAEGADDHALHLLIRRTAPSVRGGASAGVGAARGQRGGHARGTMHRTTGK
jgi:hypothetical protein